MMIFGLLYGKEGGVIVGVQERGQEESLYYFFIVSQTPANSAGDSQPFFSVALYY